MPDPLSPNHGPRRLGARPDLVGIHYTAMTSHDEALARLFPRIAQSAGNAAEVVRATRLLLPGNPPADTTASMSEKIVKHDDAPIGYHFFPDALKQTGLQRQGPASILILRAPDEAEPARIGEAQA